MLWATAVAAVGSGTYRFYARQIVWRPTGAQEGPVTGYFTVGLRSQGNTMSQGENTHTRGVDTNSSCGEMRLAAIFEGSALREAEACRSLV